MEVYAVSRDNMTEKNHEVRRRSIRQEEALSMVNPSADELRDKLGSRYKVVVIASKRARVLLEGAECLSERHDNKNVTNAFEEIVEGKITFK